LSFYLNDVQNGKNEVIRTPLLQQLEVFQILDDFEEKVFHPNIHLLGESMLEIEGNQKAKFGPRSIQKPGVRGEETYF
jgi:hypothetical protein